MNNDLKSIGMDFPRWQDAIEAAIASEKLAVTGEVRGGQLIQFADPSGAQINILAVDPFATYAGFASSTAANAHVNMVNDVLAFAEIVDDSGTPLGSVTCNLAQGPLLVDEPTMQWEQLAITALAVDINTYESAEAFAAAHPSAHTEILSMLVSQGAMIVSTGDGSQVPDASAALTARVTSAHYRTNELTGQRFIHANVDGPFPFDVCLPDAPKLPENGTILAGTVMLTGSILPPAGCGDSCGDSSSGCGCGSGGCGNH